MHYGTRSYRFEIAREYEVGPISWYYGRNCRLLVEIAGTRNPNTDMIMDLGDLDTIVDQTLVEYDHQTIKYEFHELTERIWKSIRNECNLVKRIRLYETDSTYFDKGDHELMDATRTYTFSAAHKTEHPELSKEENEIIYGKCNTKHGHEYTLEVTVRGKLNESGFDFDDDFMDDRVNPIIEKYDRTFLNDHMPNGNATTENFIRCLWNDLKEHYSGSDKYALYRLRLHETSRNYFDYYGEQ